MALNNAIRFVGLLMVAGFLFGGLADDTALQVIGFSIAGVMALAAIVIAYRQKGEEE